MTQRFIHGLFALGLYALCSLAHASATDASFDLEAINHDLGMSINARDLERLQAEALIGRHTYRILLNGRPLGEKRVLIVADPSAASGVRVEMPVQIFLEMPLRFSQLPALLALPRDACVHDLSPLIPDASLTLDTGLEEVHLHIPQIYLDESRHELAPAAVWDWGVPAIRLAYSLDASTWQDTAAGHRTNAYRVFATINPRLNAGRWRLYNRATLMRDASGQTHVDRLDTYATRVFAGLHARLRLGELTTQSRFLPGIPILGVSLGEDDSLLEPSEREYLPVISGVAQTDALVTVRQADRILLQREVPPGPFAFADIAGLGYADEVDVEVRESNGVTHHRTVAYMRSRALLKAGRTSWHAALGRYRTARGVTGLPVLTVGLAHGFNHGLTLSAGTITSERILHLRTQAAADLGQWGSASLMLEHARWRSTQETNTSAQAAELTWSKHVKATESSIALRYRHAFHGPLPSFSAMAETATRYSRLEMPTDMDMSRHRRDEIALSWNQSLTRASSLSLNALFEKTARNALHSDFSASLSTELFGATLSAYLQHARAATEFGAARSQTLASLTLSIPLSRLLSSEHDRHLTHTQLTTGIHVENGSIASEQIGLTGPAFEYTDTHCDYNVQLQHLQDQGSAFWGSLRAATPVVALQTSLSLSPRRTSLGLTASGNLLATTEGAVWSREDQGAAALLIVPHADHPAVRGAMQSTRHETVLVSALSNYRNNTLELIAESLPMNMTLIDGPVQDVCPADDAVVVKRFENFIGTQSLFTLTQEDGHPVPFAAGIELYENGQMRDTGVADASGTVYFASAPSQGRLRVHWNEDDREVHCAASYAIGPAAHQNPDALYETSLTCQCTRSPTPVSMESS